MVNPENSPNFPPKGLTNCKIFKSINYEKDNPILTAITRTQIWVHKILQLSGLTLT